MLISFYPEKSATHFDSQLPFLIMKYPGYLFGILMELYVRLGRPEEAKSILLQIENPSADLYGIMIQAYGEADKIDLALDSFHSMMKDPRINPNIEIFNVLLNVLAESSVTTPDIADRAMVILTLLNSNYRCKQLRLKPDAVTYNTFLKCLSKSFHPNIAVQAEAILDEMENRANVDRSLHPNKITYNLAIRIALRMKDRSRIDLFLARMQKSNLSADTRLFNAVLNHYAQTGSTESAQRAESLLIDMIEMGKFEYAIRPNVFSFNIVLNAWAQSEDQVARHRMWIIYLNMTSQNIELDEVTYKTLISHFAKTLNGIHQAEKLLQTIENTLEYAAGNIRLDFVLYTTVIKAFIEFNDAQNATRTLFRAIGVYERGFLRGGPSSSIYHQIVLTWIKLGDIEHASDTIYKLHDLYTAHKIPVSPHAKTFNTLIDAWNNSTRSEQNLHLVKIKAILDSQKPPAQLTA
jgi:pentatricopeptide repeat protein